MFENIPSELKALSQWVLWYADDVGRDKPTKRPINARTKGYASVSDSETWAPYEYAYSALDILQRSGNPRWQAGRCGLGFVFTENDPYCGIDLDGCRDPSTLDAHGDVAVAGWARRLITTFETYTEVTPSQRGFHLILKGVMPPVSRHRSGGVEVYDRRRFFTMTGQVLPAPDMDMEINHRQRELDELLQELNANDPPPSPAPVPAPPPTDDVPAQEPRRWQDIHIQVDPGAQPPLDKFIKLQADPAFKRTWEHKRNGEMYDNSPSTYDMGLARHAYQDGWTHQEITNLLIYNRQRLGLDKTERVDYYQRTIFKLYKDEKYERAQRDIEQADTFSSDSPEDQQLVRETIFALTGLDVLRYVQYGEAPASYGLWLRGDDGSQVHRAISTAREARSQDTWQDIAQERLKVPFVRLNPKKWQAFLVSLAAICEFEPLPEHSAMHDFEEALQTFSRQQGHAPPSDRLVLSGEAFTEDGVLHFSKAQFTQWMVMARSSEPRIGVVGKLRSVGCEQIRYSYRTETGERIQRRYWIYKLSPET